jgi:hypothetical protein
MIYFCSVVRWKFGNSKKTENPSRGLRPTSHKIQHCLSLKWLKVKVHIHKNKRIRFKKNNPLFEQ